MALTKVTELTLLAISQVNNNAVNVGTAIDVSTYYAGDVRIRFGRTTGTALTNNPLIHVEGAYKTSPTANDWSLLTAFSPSLGATIGSTAVSGTAAAAATSVTLTSATNFLSSDYSFFLNGTVANSEWKWIGQLTGTTYNLQDGLLNAQTGSTVTNQAEIYHVVLDLTSLERLRIVVINTSGQNIVVEGGLGAVSGL